MRAALAFVLWSLKLIVYFMIFPSVVRAFNHGPPPAQAIKKELADMRATAHRDTDVRGKKLADLHSDIEQVHKTASSGGDIRAFAAWPSCSMYVAVYTI